jgi:hypothetical protein
MREIRQSGSVRGVRRNPYPYRDSCFAFLTRSSTARQLALANYCGFLCSISIHIRLPQRHTKETKRFFQTGLATGLLH